MPLKPKRYLLLVLVAITSAIASSSLTAQKITTNEFLYNNYVGADTSIQDTIIQSAVLALFSDNRQAAASVIDGPSDTAFYNSLMPLLFILPQKQLYEFNLYNLEKKSDSYLLTCVVSYGFPGSTINNIVGFAKLPFVVINHQIKFQNYFLKYYKPDLIADNNGRIFTNRSNSANLPQISSYVDRVRAQYGFIDNHSSTLVYVHDTVSNNPYMAVGLDNYSLSFQGMVISFNQYYLIFDREGKGFYKHELAHYASAGKFPYKFFSEGFASCLAGSTSKCDNVCDYTQLLQFLETHPSDTGLIKIIARADRVYGPYYYPFASFTVYLMIEKFGPKFMDKKEVQAIVHTESKQEIIDYIRNSLLDGNKSITSYYITNLKKYLSMVSK
jgi:hypothetical protein